MVSPSKRRDMDMMKLMMSDFDVHIPDEGGMHDFLVAFPGPRETPYEGGMWKIHVVLPKEYPYKSPSIGFENRIFHPNVDEASGSVCLDVINQTWSPMYDLVNIFTMFLPQLLCYPNPSDPLNEEAASLLLSDPERYNNRIRDCVKKYASKAITFEDSDEEDENGHSDAETDPRRSSSMASSKPISITGSTYSSPSTMNISSAGVSDEAYDEGEESDVSAMSDLGI